MIVSSNFADSFSYCDYVPLLRPLFDHKACIAKSTSAKSNHEKSIDYSLLDLPFLEDYIKLDLYTLFLDHFEFENRAELLLVIIDINLEMSIRKNLTSCSHFNDLLVKQFIDRCTDRINRYFNKFPPYNEIFELNCNINPNQFSEVFCNVIKNSTISRQSSYLKEKAKIKSTILKELNSLKKRENWSDDNISIINHLELKLSDLEDIDNMRRFEQFKHFQCLSLQKPSKQYTKLLKNSLSL